MGLFSKKASQSSRGNSSWIPDAIEFELGDSTSNQNSNESSSALGASTLEASLSSAFLLDGVSNDDDGGRNNRNGGNNDNNLRRGPPPSGAARRKNPFDDSSSEEGEVANKKPPPQQQQRQQQQQQKQQRDYDAIKSSKSFEADMKQYEEKLTAIDNSKFMNFNDDDNASSQSSAALSGIEERSGEGSNANSNNVRRGKKTKGRGGSKFKGLFGRKSSKSSKLPRNYHDMEQQYDDEEEEGSYISGEYDEEFDNQYGIPTPTSRSTSNNNNALAIGVPSSKGGKLTIDQLEDQLYLYKLETLNLTDACRELSDQLEETEQKLESVQAQATFRIHALEAELQDGNVGLKSLVKMTSTEMDGRLDALRALGKTATIQADKLKKRDNELQNVEQQLRRTRRDIKSLKRENKKVLEERSYLKERLNEVEVRREELQQLVDGMEEDRREDIERMDMEGRVRMEECERKLKDVVEEVGVLRGQIEVKEEEIGRMKEEICGKDEEIERMKESLEMKEHDIVRVELQLEKVRNDLLEAASAARTAEEARVEAVERENEARSKLEETSDLLANEKGKVAMLRSREEELRSEIEVKTLSAEEEQKLAMQKEKLQELEKEVAQLREENEEAAQSADAAKRTYETTISDHESQIDTLKQDINVHQEQMQLAQNMLEEKENIASELHLQLVEAKEETKAKILELKDALARKSRELTNVNAELEDRTKDVTDLEEKLEQVRKEFAGKHAVQVMEAAAVSQTDEQSVKSESAQQHEALLAEKESQITRLDRELGTSKRQLEAVRVELEEKGKAIDRLKDKLDELKNKKDARVKELEAQLDSKTESVGALRKELEIEKKALSETEGKLKNVQSDLATALEASKDADALREEAVTAAEVSKAAEISAQHQCEKLKAQIDLLQKAKEKLDAELEASKEERDKDNKSSTQAAAALAATNAARQAEMEMKIEKMQKEIDFKKREMDAIKSELREKEQAASRLKGEIQAVRQEMTNYKESVESEKEKQALQRVADQDYFEDHMSQSQHSLSTGGSAHRGGGKFLGIFGRGSGEDHEDDDNIEWKKKAIEKDSRIEHMQRTITDDALTIANLRNELVSSATKFKEDESQRRLLIQRLENENHAYSIKLTALENEFNAIRQRKEDDEKLRDAKKEASFAQSKTSFISDDGSVASSVNTEGTGSIMSNQTGFTGVSAVTGASRMTPMERDNKKLKKQKKIYENRIASLQTQLSEIQLIVPELMSKSKSQISKLESVIQTQKADALKREEELKEEVEELKRQNAQLQAATRSRLQASDNNRQEEIDQLRMKLEAREATIAKLEIINKSYKKRGSLLGGKKKKKKGKNSSGVSEGGSIVSDLDTYSIAEDSILSSFN